jgi:hypothetical protein
MLKRVSDAPQRAFHRGDVTCECVEALLGGYHLVPLRLKCRNHLAEARAVGPDTVAEHDAWFGLHISLAPMGCFWFAPAGAVEHDTTFGVNKLLCTKSSPSTPDYFGDSELIAKVLVDIK